MPQETARAVRKVDLSPFSWIEPAETLHLAREVAKQVVALKFKPYGLPRTVQSKEDVRDVLLSLGWSIPVELDADEIERIKQVASRESGGDTISDVCVVPGTDRRHSFICVRIRRSVVQADRENVPLHLVNDSKKRKRSEALRKNGKVKSAAAAAAERSPKKARTDRAADEKQQQKE